ncbi:MAG: leucyl/phenylalanyl-tRNA--protein transferase [Rhodobacteraceae bacterium]|nr:leucyl/phenylalanyl-tRNA--protein transferase [Paracoccaceae bacterium]
MSNRRLELSPTLLLNAYAAGVFPMADSADDPDIYWVDPAFRGVLPMEGFRVSRSLAKTIRRGAFTVTINRSFDGVLDGCADRSETWINHKIRELYGGLNDYGYCHSVEVWVEGELVGGLYGVTLGGAYFGESMFSYRPDASKIALVYLMARLKVGGFTLVDTQFVTEHLRRFGATEISRSAYHLQLEQALERNAEFLRLDPETPPQEVLQLSTQTS